MEGSTAIESTRSTRYPEIYCSPTRDRAYFGATRSPAINGAVRLKLILMLSVDKSLFDVEEAGITMYAMLEAKDPIINDIIMAI